MSRFPLWLRQCSLNGVSINWPQNRGKSEVSEKPDAEEMNEEIVCHKDWRMVEASPGTAFLDTWIGVCIPVAGEWRKTFQPRLPKDYDDGDCHTSFWGNRNPKSIPSKVNNLPNKPILNLPWKQVEVPWRGRDLPICPGSGRRNRGFGKSSVIWKRATESAFEEKAPTKSGCSRVALWGFQCIRSSFTWDQDSVKSNSGRVESWHPGSLCSRTKREMLETSTISWIE